MDLARRETLRERAMTRLVVVVPVDRAHLLEHGAVREIVRGHREVVRSFDQRESSLPEAARDELGAEEVALGALLPRHGLLKEMVEADAHEVFDRVRPTEEARRLVG